MFSAAAVHPSSQSTLSAPRLVPLTDLPETAQIILSEKPRLINVTHQIPYACTVIDRSGSCANTSSASALGNGSPTIRRPSLATPRHPAASSSALEDSDPSIAQGVAAMSNGGLEPILEDGDCILEPRRGHSAMYSGIKSLEKDLETIQIGWVGELADQDGYMVPCKNLSKKHMETLKSKLWEREKVVPIFLEDSRAAGHYEGYCKSVLWPLFHYILWDEATDGRVEKQNWDDYVFVNEQFADAIAEQYQPGDIERVEFLNGLLSANQIGFQTYSYARHFISCCTRVNGYESTPRGVDAMGSTVWVGTFPIGIDAERVESQRKAPGVLPKMEAIRKTYKGKRIIVGRDKLDVVKGVQQKLHAFEKFLNDYPEMQGEVVLIQVTSPPLVENPKLEAKIAELVAHINGTYGSLNFTPVHHYHQHIDRDEYYALLSVADIGLITSFTGTAGSLGGALMVNPWDYQGVARVIYDALHLSEEDKRSRHSYWAKHFVSELILNVSTWDQSTPTPYLDQNIIVEKYRSAKKRLLMFDYDGTLTPIRKTPGAAVPQEHMLKALTALANDPDNIVWVISGRDQKVLEEWLGEVDNLGFSAEHGSFMRQPRSKKWVNLTESLDMSWKNDVIEIFTYYTERTQGSFIEHKRSSLTWHYRMADPEFGAFQAKECQNHLENAVLSKLPVEILVGKKNLEVRPTIVNKGEIVKRLLSQHPEVEFILCAGDDKTDEDMFRALAGVSNNGGHNRRDSLGGKAVIEPYNDELVAATAAKIARATQQHSHAHVHSGQVLSRQNSDVLNGTAKRSDLVTPMPYSTALPQAPPTPGSITSLTSLNSQGSGSNMANEHFSITIGHALKKTLANWHVTSPEELIRILGILSGVTEA
ncbi:threalose-6-phosphate phosphatase [Modicella reniformis]|uniref:Threalose-6-phosphate phosphatase n=1 Tax=Modicella reniformis TaxID=1440133 RepID=A0A9P6LRP0_9FUNG|nr:threalose-6-phosphate phosphatase [Modicella reniformis]